MDGVKARLNFNLCMAKLEAEKSARGDQYSKHLYEETTKRIQTEIELLKANTAFKDITERARYGKKYTGRVAPHSNCPIAILRKDRDLTRFGICWTLTNTIPYIRAKEMVSLNVITNKKDFDYYIRSLLKHPGHGSVLYVRGTLLNNLGVKSGVYIYQTGADASLRFS